MGRTALMMVASLTFVILVLGPNMYRYASSSYANFTTYNGRTMAHNIAVSGANIAANQIFLNKAWTTGYSNLSLSGGTFNVWVTAETTSYGVVRKRIHSTSLYTTNNQNFLDTIEVLLGPSTFAEFCVYLQNMGGGVSWATGDSVYGPCHIDSVMNISGSPVFFGKTTSKNGTNPKLPHAGVTPQFLGGYQSGVAVPMPQSFGPTQDSATARGKVFTPPGSPSGNYSLTVTLNSDSTITYQEAKGAWTGPLTTVKILTLAPNATIWVNGGNINIQGTLKGRLTIIAGGTKGSSTTGNAFITGNIKYATDPLLAGAGTDMLGLMADNSIDIPAPPGFNPPTVPAQHDVIIEAGVFTRTGKFYTDLYNNTKATGLGSVRLIGSLTSYNIGAFSTPNSDGSVKYGYRNYFQFDNRFYVSCPPNYPITGFFEVLLWKE
ncbi:MAG: hypothetical protein ACHQQQ_12735 [Bacteroidota bacterium]